MDNKGRLLATELVSAFAIGISEITILTLMYNISGLSGDAALLISIRLFASLLVFIAIQRFNNIVSLKSMCMISDFLRAIFILLAIFSTFPYQIFFIAFLLSFLSGVNSTAKISGYQKFVSSEERIDFISRQQFLLNFISIVSPFIASLLIDFLSINTAFLAESSCFLISIFILRNINNWDTENVENNKYSVSFIFSDSNQSRILIFRLSILGSMMSFQVLSIYFLTDHYNFISRDISNLTIISQASYSSLISFLSIVSSISLLIGSYLSGKLFKIDSIHIASFSGAVLVFMGCLLWSLPYSIYFLPLYIIGCSSIYIGLSFLRVFLYTLGQELTPPEALVKVIAASDLISRTCQSGIGVFALWLIPILTVSGTFQAFAFSALGTLIVSKHLSKQLQEKLR